MEKTESGNESETDLGEWIGGRRRLILQAIRFHNGKAHTSEIRDQTGLSRGSYRHHIDLLLDPPEDLVVDGEPLGDGSFIELVETEDVGSGIPAHEFVLTEAGKYIFKETIDDIAVRADDVRDLRQKVEELESELDETQERFKSLVEENKRLSTLYNEMAEGIEKLIEENDLAYSEE